ncbi:MAG: ATP-binding cassette domain-containing protein [Candidatus Aegiribacteria sp.]|nr:ATP-binding cassette domain-containing protein [Candidatus Aegiribacteria sp.]
MFSEVKKDDMTALKVINLSKTYRESTGEVHALGPVSFEMETGEFLCFLGPTGCGKTTLLRTIAGLEKPDTGKVIIPSRSGGEEPVIGYVFQQGALFPWMSIFANLEFPLKAKKIVKDSRREKVESMLEMMGLSSFASSYPHQLSGGMQQRAALARSLVMEPDLLLMDEPFSSLDTRTSQKLQENLRDLLKKASTTVLFVTHNIEEAVYLAGEIIVLGHRPGRIVRRETIDLSDPRSRVSESFTEYLVSLRKTFESLVSD